MKNQKLRFFGFLGSFLLKPDFFHFLELERFLKSFDVVLCD
ncbi:hypothetical protein [Helicobacter pylori]